jgi:hypothetical protein
VNDRVRTRDWLGVDYYAELGITSDATRAAVDEAYRRRAKELHPDTNLEETAEDSFKRLTAAYEVLRDPVTRQAYDAFRLRVEADLARATELSRVRTGKPLAPTGAQRVPVRRQRRPLPRGLRLGIAYALLVAGVAAAAWALFGPLPSHTAGDTEFAVQITLGIMSAKLLICGVVVIKYPELKARWHPAPDRVSRPVSPSRRGIEPGRPRPA